MKSYYILAICLTWGSIIIPVSSVLAQRGFEEKSFEFYQKRGIEYFSLGKFEECIRDFDRAIELEPRLKSRHWQRGIAYYYGKEFSKGIDQFELHQTVNPQDVENAVWHFICKVRIYGVEAARAALIPVRHDSRVPMMEIWDLFAGKSTPEKVLIIAENSSRYKRQAFNYAHLYLGLYYEALEKHNLAKKHIDLAAREYSMNNYMGMVAQVHAKLLEK
tara:strand:+ start:2502 stop:3155 length:654 start_codon:yes stop_codon:yes gene_type:complete